MKSLIITGIVLVATVALTVPVAASVTGYVTDTGGQPVEGALVTFTDEANPDNYYLDYTDDEGLYEVTLTTVSVAHDQPVPFTLMQNFPNPFNPTTTIPYSLSTSSHVLLDIFNIIGQRVTTLVNNHMAEGSHSASWNGRDESGKAVGAGIYLYRLTSGDMSEARKMLLLDGGGISSGNYAGVSPGVVAKPAAPATASMFTVSVIKGGYYDFSEENTSIEDGTTFDIELTSYETSYEIGSSDTNGQLQVTDYVGNNVIVSFKNIVEEPITGLEIYSQTNPTGTTVFSIDPENRYFSSVHHISSDSVQKPAPIIMWDFTAEKNEDYMESTNVTKIEDYTDAHSMWRYFQLLHKDERNMWRDSKIWKRMETGAWDTYDGWNEIEHVVTVVFIHDNSSFERSTLLLVKESYGESARSILTDEYNKLNAQVNIKHNIAVLLNDCLLGGYGNIEGDVNDADKRLFSGLKNVEVSITDGPTRDVEPVVTGRTGSFSFGSLVPGIYTLEAREMTPMSIIIGGEGVPNLSGVSGEPLEIENVFFRDYTNTSRFIEVHPNRYSSCEFFLSAMTLTGVSPILYFRKNGETSFSSTAMTPADDGEYKATIPGNIVTTAGVEFKVEGTYGGESVETPVYSVPVAGGGGGGDPHDISGMTFVTIPGGTFQMGDEVGDLWSACRPVHTVTVSSFEMGIYEVTNAQYASYLTDALASGDITATSSSVKGASGDWSGQEYLDLDGSTYCQISYSGGTFLVDTGMENRPVVEVTWYGSKSFALYYGLDLPTEAEWEYACRGGQQLMYGTDDGTIDSSKANYNRNVDHTTDVGSYPDDPFGLYDMSGNVWEWCHDWYGAYTSDDATNPSGAQSGSSRMIRGGYWGGDAGRCRAAYRDGYGPGGSCSSVGFRVVRRSSPQNY